MAGVDAQEAKASDASAPASGVETKYTVMENATDEVEVENVVSPENKFKSVKNWFVFRENKPVGAYELEQHSVLRPLPPDHVVYIWARFHKDITVRFHTAPAP